MLLLLYAVNNEKINCEARRRIKWRKRKQNGINMAELLLFGYFCSTSCIALMISTIFHSMLAAALFSLALALEWLAIFFSFIPFFSRSLSCALVRSPSHVRLDGCVGAIRMELRWSEYRVNVQWTTRRIYEGKMNKITHNIWKNQKDDQKRIFLHGVEPTCHFE